MLTIIAGMVVGKVQIQRNASSAQACILSSSMHPQLKHASSARAGYGPNAVHAVICKTRWQYVLCKLLKNPGRKWNNPPSSVGATSQSVSIRPWLQQRR